MGQDVCLIRSSSQNQRFLNYVMHSPFMIEQLNRLLIGSTFRRINVGQINALLVPVPPGQEQDRIVSRLDFETIEIQGVVDRITREIALIREYRTRLVADVVTGQLDVRAAAAKLPDLPTEEAADLLAEADPLDTDDPLADDLEAEGLELETADAAD